MKESEINVNIFGSHSTRSASTLKCKISGLLIKEIAKSAGWSNQKTFAQLYDRLIQENFSNYLFIFIYLLLYLDIVLTLHET